MPTTYELARQDDLEQLREAMEAWHEWLVKAEVRVAVLMARSEDDSPVKLHGYPCAATVKINSLKDRVEGKGDATITIDAREWEDMPTAERMALLDHELQHLELVFEKNSQTVWRTDDLGRPKLRMRLHDWQLGGFSVIVRRHGPKSIDANAVEAASRHVQGLLFDHEHGHGVADVA